MPQLLPSDRAGAIEFEDYSHFALASRFAAAGLGLPFAAVRSLLGSDLLGDGTATRGWLPEFESPFGGGPVVLLPSVVSRRGRRPWPPRRQTATCRSTARRGDRGAGAGREKGRSRPLSRSSTLLCFARRRTTRSSGHARIADRGGALRRPSDGDVPPVRRRLRDIREYVEASRDPERFATHLEQVTAGAHAAYLERIGLRRLLELRADPFFGYHLDREGDEWRA